MKYIQLTAWTKKAKCEKCDMYKGESGDMRGEWRYNTYGDNRKPI